ncbi:sulfate permease [Rubrobacter tropicus]|uniref:Sulfate permease n=1 Tax=Rubrobacter tropicus TaxID=2653851 RepID=A0A6G8Q4S1_9ACTN|nr:sulfate permease [Rubrobacter tropicus]QIN81438.1 sulfate permease [Rubrobacter tropicus]
MKRGLPAAFPFLGWLGAYRRADLPRDLSAGLVVGVMLVPQAMAYALLAGLPPVYGLYASIVPTVAYALFGTSRHMPVGPPALMALLTFSGVSALAEPGSGEYVGLALLLALMAGVLQLGLGLLRLGFVSNFIPLPVLSGFVYASAVVISLSQAASLLGIPAGSERSTPGILSSLAGRIGETNLPTLAIGVGGIVALVAMAKLLPRVPGALVVATVATVIVYGLGLRGMGVEVVGEIPAGLPGLSVPPLGLETVRGLLPAALAVALVGFVESVSVAKAVAAKERYRLESNAELRGLGLANIAAAFTSGMPVAGSFSRTAVQYGAGARTQLASVVTAGVVVLTLLFLTPLFYYLPDAALAAVILVAVFGLLDFRQARRIFEVSPVDGAALVITFLVTLFVGVEEGILAGALFALLAFLRRTAYPNVTQMGFVQEERAYLDVERWPAAETYPDVLIVRFDAALYYANIPYLEEKLIELVAEKPEVEWIVIDCRGVNAIDVTAVEGLEALVQGYRSRGVGILLTHVKLLVRERLAGAGWSEKFGDWTLRSTNRDAVAYARSRGGA